MTTIEFLNAVRKYHGLTSDRQLAHKLELPEGRVSLFRTGKRTLDPVTCRKVADLLELPTAYVMASIQAERAKHPVIKAEYSPGEVLALQLRWQQVRVLERELVRLRRELARTRGDGAELEREQPRAAVAD